MSKVHIEAFGGGHEGGEAKLVSRDSRFVTVEFNGRWIQFRLRDGEMAGQAKRTWGYRLAKGERERLLAT